MTEPTLREKDLDLVKMFIKREAEDYTPTKSDEWQTKVFKRVLAAVGRTENPNYISIESYSNMGLQSRTLTLDATTKDTNWEKAKRNYTIGLCSCGDLRHLVWIRGEEKYEGIPLI